jgi:hypothetical protein
MSSITTHAAPAKSVPEAPLFSWVLPPVQGWGLLTIRDTLYRVQEVPYEESDGTPRMIVKLARAGAECEYQLSPNADGDLCCDCPDAIYRDHARCCKHVLAVTAAYDWLANSDRLDAFLVRKDGAA